MSVFEQLSPLNWQVPIVDAEGRPSADFGRLVQQLIDNAKFTQAEGEETADAAEAAAGTAIWGGITGTLTNQTDLTTVLAGKQPLDDDLTALSAASGTHDIYYRSGAGAWSAVTIGAGLSFTGATLDTSGSGTAILADGDYGDVVVSGSGTVMTVESAAGDFDVTGLVTVTGAIIATDFIQGESMAGVHPTSTTTLGDLGLFSSDFSEYAVIYGGGFWGGKVIFDTDQTAWDFQINSVSKFSVTATGAAAAGTLSATGAVSGSNLSGTNTGDQTSIVGITGTLAQFNTAITDANIPQASTDLSDSASLYKAGGTDVALADGGTGASLADPNADRLMFWDDSAGSVAWLTLGTNLSITSTTINAASGLADADYGDVVVSGGGTVLTIDSGVVSYAKMQDVSATDKLLGRSTAGAGDVEEIPCTAFARTILDDADAATVRTTIGASIPPHPGYIAGKWYYPPLAGQAGNGSALVNGSVRLVPFVLSKPITISDLGCRVTTLAAGGNVRLAIYIGDPATGKPVGAPVVETGNISTAATGPLSAAVTPAALTPGLHFMAVNADNATAALQNIGTSPTSIGMILGSATLATVNWNAAGSYFIYTFASAFGAFPDLTGQTLVETSSTNAWGLVMLKAS